MCSKVEFIFDKMLTYCNELEEVGSKSIHPDSQKYSYFINPTQNAILHFSGASKLYGKSRYHFFAVQCYR